MFFLRFCGGEAGSSSTTSKYGGVKELESVTLQELNSYVLNSTPHVRPLNKMWSSFANLRWLILTRPIDRGALSPVLCARASCFVDSHLSAVTDVMMTMFRVQMALKDVTDAALFVAFVGAITKLSLGGNQS
ncbi:hypothetical protein Bca4012_011181 [Brassica carinata]